MGLSVYLPQLTPWTAFIDSVFLGAVGCPRPCSCLMTVFLAVDICLFFLPFLLKCGENVVITCIVQRISTQYQCLDWVFLTSHLNLFCRVETVFYLHSKSKFKKKILVKKIYEKVFKILLPHPAFHSSNRHSAIFNSSVVLFYYVQVYQRANQDVKQVLGVKLCQMWDASGERACRCAQCYSSCVDCLRGRPWMGKILYLETY